MKKSVFILLLCLLHNISNGQLSLSKSQLARLDSISTQDVPKEAPGIATAIISEGQIIYQKFAGYENLQTGSEIDNHSRFNLASNGKQFTALAILILEERGKLKLTDDIRTYLPELFVNLPNKISIQNLLNHTSGIRDVYDLWSLQGITWWQETFGNKDVLELLKKQTALNFEPGSKYLYSNSNYILLAEIIERVSKESFVSFTNGIFNKLNMNQSSFEDRYGAIKGPIAKAYFNFDTWSNYDWKWNVVGDGNFFSTLNDQMEWEKIVQGFGNPGISMELIRRSQTLIDDTSTFNYGFGLEFGEYKGMPYRFHEGATGAWKATVVRFERDNLSIVTMTNSGKTIPSIQTRQMIDVVFNLEDASNTMVTRPPIVGDYVSEDDILGLYLTPNNFLFEFKKREDGSLVLNRIGRGETELIREADNIFQQKYDPAFKQEFTKNDKGEMVVTAYYTTHAPYSLTRANSNWDGYDFKGLEGTYTNKETNVSFSIAHETDKNYTVLLNNQRNQGVLVTPGKLLVNNYMFEIERQDGVFSSLLLSADRISKVQFKRND